MSRKGDCWDNAVAESFFSTLEFEGPPTTTWRFVSDGELEMFTFIERYYNQTRIHSHNGYKTPNERPRPTCAIVRWRHKPGVHEIGASSHLTGRRTQRQGPPFNAPGAGSRRPGLSSRAAALP
jgi:Integrase core domain